MEFFESGDAMGAAAQPAPEQPADRFPEPSSSERASTGGAGTARATAPVFSCYICEESSTEICARCTRDACDNHLCERCGHCSDCCACEQ